ncbi:DnaJ like protein subfamily B member 12 [Fasciola gigantica]|uniref:DnaJ like protein subfamily B member 12 n=1 Tax=Fasciola gigantica TaxID=46835 RepID=A0A504Y2W1_FASGI|nr:DnaJ like protein subfamily B member 12 [Fasciola gigantica]
MDANKDEALRCVAMARKRMAVGDLESARRILAKALRLYPSVSVHGLESLLRTSRSPSRERLSHREETESPSAEPQRSANTSSQSTFTKSQADAVRRVLACKDYYEILGVSRESTEEQIRRAYKVLALKFHPDKNRAPGATEAFKKIGTALNVLTDAEKRRRYDQFGTEEEQPPRITRVHRHGDAFFQYDSDVFTMFFNGGFPFSQVYGGHRPRQRSRESERENNYFIYVQLVPLILIFALSFFSNMFIKDPFYSLNRSTKYPIERFTENRQIPYYVKTTFRSDFDGNLNRLEVQVEEEYANNLRIHCYREREYKESLLYRARYYGDAQGHERAQKIQLQSCDRLVQIFGS